MHKRRDGTRRARARAPAPAPNRQAAAPRTHTGTYLRIYAHQRSAFVAAPSVWGAWDHRFSLAPARAGGAARGPGRAPAGRPPAARQCDTGNDARPRPGRSRPATARRGVLICYQRANFPGPAAKLCPPGFLLVGGAGADPPAAAAPPHAPQRPYLHARRAPGSRRRAPPSRFPASSCLRGPTLGSPPGAARGGAAPGARALRPPHPYNGTRPPAPAPTLARPGPASASDVNPQLVQGAPSQPNPVVPKTVAHVRQRSAPLHRANAPARVRARAAPTPTDPQCASRMRHSAMRPGTAACAAGPAGGGEPRMGAGRRLGGLGDHTPLRSLRTSRCTVPAATKATPLPRHAKGAAPAAGAPGLPAAPQRPMLDAHVLQCAGRGGRRHALRPAGGPKGHAWWRSPTLPKAVCPQRLHVPYRPSGCNAS